MTYSWVPFQKLVLAEEEHLIQACTYLDSGENKSLYQVNRWFEAQTYT